MKHWKGIIMAGGNGTRLYPLTLGVSKQLLPVYDKPMIYYPLSILMLCGIREISIIVAPSQLTSFQSLLGDGTQWGCKFNYVVQPKADGIAQAFSLCRKYSGGSSTCLILGDNLFYGQGLPRLLETAMNHNPGATIFGCRVNDPSRYGIVEFDSHHNCISLEEKPKTPKSNYAVTGLYFYDDSVYELASNLKPSLRGELEITDLNILYMKENKLRVEVFERGIAWLDTGTHQSLLEASSFVQAVQTRQGLLIASPEEIAWRKGFIDSAQLERLGNECKKTAYGAYLLNILKSD